MEKVLDISFTIITSDPTCLQQVAQDHAEQIAKLKQAKEEAEAKQIALQKEMNAEMERLKTQFIFKVRLAHIGK